MKLLKIFACFICASVLAGALFADEKTYEAQITLNSLGYDVGAIDGIWGKKTAAALSDYCTKKNIDFKDELTPKIWIELVNDTKTDFEFPTLTKAPPFFEKRSLDLVAIRTNNKNENCSWLVDFYRYERGHPMNVQGVKNRYKNILVPDVANAPETFENLSNEIHDTITAMSQECYSEARELTCSTVIELANLMKDEGAFVFNTEIKNLGNDTFYYTTKRILNPLLLAYANAIKRVGKPANHAEIGKWFYAALLQNSFDVYSPKKNRQRDMLFFDPPPNVKSSCEKYALSFNHSLYQSLGLSFYGVIWDDELLASQAFDRLIFSLKSGALNADGVNLCSASRGSNAMMYSGSDMLNILYAIELARNQGLSIETSEFVSKVEKAGNFIFKASFDLSLIHPYAKENHLSWCSSNYEDQCMYIGFGRIAAFSWMRHFVSLYPDSELSEKILSIKAAPYRNDDEGVKVSSAIAKSNFMISEVDWPLPTEQSDGHEMHTRANGGTHFLNIMDANLVSNVCALQ
jgi:hypothetical protein